MRLADPQPRGAPERDDRRHRPQRHTAVVEGLRRGGPLPGAGGAGSESDGVAEGAPDAPGRLPARRRHPQRDLARNARQRAGAGRRTGQFEPVGSTTGSSYIARTHAHRVYEVVAENAAGETSNRRTSRSGHARAALNVRLGARAAAPPPGGRQRRLRGAGRPRLAGGAGARRRRSRLVARSPRARAAAAGAAAADGGLREKKSPRWRCAWNGDCAYAGAAGLPWAPRARITVLASARAATCSRCSPSPRRWSGRARRQGRHLPVASRGSSATPAWSSPRSPRGG